MTIREDPSKDVTSEKKSNLSKEASHPEIWVKADLPSRFQMAPGTNGPGLGTNGPRS